MTATYNCQCGQVRVQKRFVLLFPRTIVSRNGNGKGDGMPEPAILSLQDAGYALLFACCPVRVALLPFSLFLVPFPRTRKLRHRNK